MARAIFFSRDGTLNKLVDGSEPRTLAEFKLYPFARKSVVLATKLGFKTFVVSHQPPEVDRGDLEKMNRKFYTLGVDGVYNDSVNHLEAIIKTYKIDRTLSYMICDKGNDIVEGYGSGLTCLYVGAKVYPFSEYDLTFNTALEAVNYIKSKEKK